MPCASKSEACTERPSLTDNTARMPPSANDFTSQGSRSGPARPASLPGTIQNTLSISAVRRSPEDWGALQRAPVPIAYLWLQQGRGLVQVGAVLIEGVGHDHRKLVGRIPLPLLDGLAHARDGLGAVAGVQARSVK